MLYLCRSRPVLAFSGAGSGCSGLVMLSRVLLNVRSAPHSGRISYGSHTRISRCDNATTVLSKALKKDGSIHNTVLHTKPP